MRWQKQSIRKLFSFYEYNLQSRSDIVNIEKFHFSEGILLGQKDHQTEYLADSVK